MLWGVLRILRGVGAKFKKLASDVHNIVYVAALVPSAKKGGWRGSGVARPNNVRRFRHC